MILIDVRTAEEYRTGYIAGSVNIPLADIKKFSAADKSTPIQVYCKSGGRAAQARNSLLAMGYTDVTNIGGLAGKELTQNF